MPPALVGRGIQPEAAGHVYGGGWDDEGGGFGGTDGENVFGTPTSYHLLSFHLIPLHKHGLHLLYALANEGRNIVLISAIFPLFPILILSFLVTLHFSRRGMRNRTGMGWAIFLGVFELGNVFNADVVSVDKRAGKW
jgi:hypothetical protein